MGDPSRPDEAVDNDSDRRSGGIDLPWSPDELAWAAVGVSLVAAFLGFAAAASMTMDGDPVPLGHQFEVVLSFSLVNEPDGIWQQAGMFALLFGPSIGMIMMLAGAASRTTVVRDASAVFMLGVAGFVYWGLQVSSDLSAAMRPLFFWGTIASLVGAAAAMGFATEQVKS